MAFKLSSIAFLMLGLSGLSAESVEVKQNDITDVVYPAYAKALYSLQPKPLKTLIFPSQVQTTSLDKSAVFPVE